MLAALLLCACGTEESVSADMPEAVSSDEAPPELELLKAQNAGIIENSLKYFSAGVDTEDVPILELVAAFGGINAVPVYDDTEFEYFPDGEDAFKDMLESLRGAGDYIFMEYFVIDTGTVWDEFHEILKEKAAEGVDVRILVDGWAVQWTLPVDFVQQLNEEGIKTFVSSPISSGSDIVSVIRDHRKILVVDGKCAYTGGMNLADEYANRIDKYGYWKDNTIKLKGECVKSYVLMFLQMWELFGEETEYERYLEACERLEGGGDLCMPFCDGPLDDVGVGREVYMNILRNSKEEVRITVPYFVPDDEFEALLLKTAKRGVKITLILPGIQDKPIVQKAARTYFRELTDAGISVYEYTPGFIHQKVMVSDGCRCSVGTVNLDNRSFVGQYECGVYFYSPELAAQLNEDIDAIISVSTLMTPEIMDEMGIKDGDSTKVRNLSNVL
ncbi:MAG: phosphatidylserine/phosphatidylglycerophosphate/cardiolipin synthase family protein [Lachnospiraceae bacterium]|nr:phosphatidylserine/phosphatidylglycerophosphate/cardiolipin synthase family protein [Lachnospiraceae bacterium]